MVFTMPRIAVALISDRSDAFSTLEGIANANIKQLERGEAQQLAVELISARSDAFFDFRRNCKCQQEELQSKIKQLERREPQQHGSRSSSWSGENHNSMAVELISADPMRFSTFEGIASANMKSYKA
uniref:Uncharacterized protein n=1 Tax=Globodera rostochiensis TaxID=31243 RepID=A0A914IG95_GLORO